jgi:hypothetical protein
MMSDGMTWGDGLKFSRHGYLAASGWPQGIDDSGDGVGMSEAARS